MDSMIKLFVSLLLFFCSSHLFGEINGVEGSNDHHRHLYGPKKLFVFGDSPSPLDMKAYIEKVVDSLYSRIIRLGDLLFKKIAITSLQPIGCSPYFSSASSFKSCNESYSELVKVHNDSLKKVVAKLNEDSRLGKKGQRYFIIDIHNAFITILKNKGSTRFKKLLNPCCEGACARVDSKGAKMYTLCDDPKTSFFWDIVHPTQEGWKSVYSVLGRSFNRVFNQSINPHFGIYNPKCIGNF